MIPPGAESTDILSPREAQDNLPLVIPDFVSPPLRVWTFIWLLAFMFLGFSLDAARFFSIQFIKYNPTDFISWIVLDSPIVCFWSPEDVNIFSFFLYFFHEFPTIERNFLHA